MRSGACTLLQQTLTAEAASVLKHSLGLARRRGHAQVTPLHVAATLLSLRASSLRRACLKSQPHHQTASHPLQCRALELCFNVALNRLPTTPGGPLLHSQPSLSNALIAALKRAQAHHRRGCLEQQQQQPLLTVKIELEQLIISILDDPSVSRVMREAGFSSIAVKNNLDDSSASSVYQGYNNYGGVFSSPCSPPCESQRETIINPTNDFRRTNFSAYSFEYNPVLFSPLKRSPVYPPSDSTSSKEDIKLVLDILLRKKKKNTVIVGDSVCITEALVGELKGRLERGEVPDELKLTSFIKFQFAPVSLSFMKKEDVEMNLSELERKVDSIASDGGGAIIYIGDLKWIVEPNFSGKKGYSQDEEVSEWYNPVDHLVAEIGKLFSDYGSSKANKVWLMATASYQTYMRCQVRRPPLETQWALQAVPVPSSGLGLSLHASSVLDSKMSISQNSSNLLEAKPFNDNEEQDKLTCCEECASNYEKDAQLFKPGQKKLLPSWLQSPSIEAHQKDELTQLRRKWNRLCYCLHQNKHSQNQWSNSLYSNHSSNGKIYPYSSSYPWWPNQGSMTPDSSSISFADSIAKPSYSSNLVPRFRRQQSCAIEFNLSNETEKQKAIEPSLDSLKGMEGKEVRITLALGNSPFGDSGQTVENITDRTLRRAHICKLLQENVPWQSETVTSIAEAFVDSKSAKQNSSWIFMQGNDSIGKRRLARAIAESIFGSAHLLFNLDMRKKETLVTPYSEMLTRALKTHEQLVILIENADFADAHFKKFLADGFKTGKFGDFSTAVEQGRAIFILTNNSSTTSSDEQNHQDSVIRLVLQVISETTNSKLGGPSLDHKRKAEWDLFTKIKSPRIEEKEDVVLVSEQGNRKIDFSRQSSFNTLDLNIRADEDNDGEDKTRQSSPIFSDLTRETMVYAKKPDGFLDSIDNRFEFNRNAARDKEIAAFFLSKIKRSFEEVCGKESLENFTVEETVLQEVSFGCGSFTNSLFEKWLKDIFQSSLQSINYGGKDGIVFKLCWGGKGDRILDSGFMSSSLPKNIQVNYFMD